MSHICATTKPGSFLQLMITPLVSSNLWPLYICPSLIYWFWLPLWYLQTCGHCFICPSSIYSLWLPLWYLQTCGHCIISPSSIYSLWLPGGAFGIFKHFLCDYFIRTKNEEKPKPLTYLVLLHNDFM